MHSAMYREHQSPLSANPVGSLPTLSMLDAATPGSSLQPATTEGSARLRESN